MRLHVATTSGGDKKNGRKHINNDLTIASTLAFHDDDGVFPSTCGWQVYSAPSKLVRAKSPLELRRLDGNTPPPPPPASPKPHFTANTDVSPAPEFIFVAHVLSGLEASVDSSSRQVSFSTQRVINARRWMSDGCNMFSSVSQRVASNR